MKYVIALALQAFALPAMAHHTYDAAPMTGSDHTALWIGVAAIMLAGGVAVFQRASAKV